MFGGKIGLPELAVIVFIALLIFGPKKLGELGKGLGEGIKQFQVVDERRCGQHHDFIFDLDRRKEITKVTFTRSCPAKGTPRSCLCPMLSRFDSQFGPRAFVTSDTPAAQVIPPR